MERKIGEIFNYQDNLYQCIKSITCTNCGFNNKGCLADKHITGDCSGRLDGASVIFRKLEKVGEPTMLDGKLVQKILTTDRYSCNGCCFESPRCDKADNDLCCEHEIFVEIKQNKEDMEEEKLNLKKFDLEAAKAGKPVCTRDGRKARILCYDLKGAKYPIVAAIETQDYIAESISAYDKNGRFVHDKENNNDLMMLLEKKEGWINIYTNSGSVETGINIYKTEEIAKSSASNSSINYLDTIKIEWKE